MGQAAICSAFGCLNQANSGEKKQFFGFPLQNEELLKRWIVGIGRQNFVPTKHSKVCSDHFEVSDYLVRPGTYLQHLKPDAVPALFIEYSSPTSVEAIDDKSTCLTDGTPLQIKIENSLEFSHQPLTPAIPRAPSPTKTILRRKIKTLKQKLRRRDEKIKSLKSLLIKGIKKKKLLDEKSRSELLSKFEGAILEVYDDKVEGKSDSPQTSD